MLSHLACIIPQSRNCYPCCIKETGALRGIVTHLKSHNCNQGGSQAFPTPYVGDGGNLGVEVSNETAWK